jgi:nitrile hydratase accessory protein
MTADEQVAGIPRDAEGPVFREPWEAQAFAMTLALHRRGLFTWPEWAAALGAEIKRAQAAGDPDTGETYYRHWLNALETLALDYLATIMLIVGLGLVFYFIPNAKTRFRDVWLGAAFTGMLWRLGFDGFTWYVKTVKLSQIPRSIFTVVIFLLWIYVSSIILMYGVEFTAGYARLRRRRPDDVPAAPTPRV